MGHFQGRHTKSTGLGDTFKGHTKSTGLGETLGGSGKPVIVGINDPYWTRWGENLLGYSHLPGDANLDRSLVRFKARSFGDDVFPPTPAWRIISAKTFFLLKIQTLSLIERIQCRHLMVAEPLFGTRRV